MCNRIRTPDGVWCDSLSALAAAIGEDTLQGIMDAGTHFGPDDQEQRFYWRQEPDCCLCPVPRDALEKRMGWVRQDDPFDCIYDAAPRAA
jgi:hypothetical protein